MKMRMKLIAMIFLIAFTSMSQCFAGPEGFVVNIVEFVGGYYKPTSGEEIWGRGPSNNVARYYTGNGREQLFGMYQGAPNRPYNEFSESLFAFFRGGGYDYFNDYFVTPPEGRDYPMPGVTPGGYYADDKIRIPPKTTITAYRMNEPVAGVTFRLVNDMGSYRNQSPRPVTTGADGKAVFRAPSRSYRAASVDATGRVTLWYNPVSDYVKMALCNANGVIVDINEEVEVGVGGSGRWNIYAEDRPVVHGLFSEAYDARNNRIIAEWEDLTGIPDHYYYTMLIMDPNTGDVLGSANTQNNFQAWILPVNSTFAFAIIAYDRNQNAYCNSFIYTFDTGPAKWTGATTRSLSADRQSLVLEKSAEKKVEPAASLYKANGVAIEDRGETFTLESFSEK